jgi:cytochrome c oxidase subunit 5b
MFKNAVRAARPAANAVRLSLKPCSSSLRAFSTTVRAQSGPAPPQLFGPGAKPGTVPTDIEQATGLERLQLLGDLEGINVFDDSPLDSSRIGTKANPVLVPSFVRDIRCYTQRVQARCSSRLIDSNNPTIGNRAHYWMHRRPRRFA